MSRYITGVTMRLSNVDEINPPIITQASGPYSPDPDSASGSSPPMAVTLVNSTGKNRTSPACSMASRSAMPRARNCVVKSTSSSEFLISIPMSAMKPMTAV